MNTDRRKFLTLTLVSALGLVVAGCDGLRPDMSVDELLALLQQRMAEDDNSAEDDEGTGDTGPVTIALTHPAGRSPKVFTSGWVFGAKATRGSEDLSDEVKWSGTGSFNPDTGAMSRPSFSSEGSNTIFLAVTLDGKTYRKAFTIDAISPSGFAAIGDQVVCPADEHGCPACPHPTVGHITAGSPNVFVNGRNAARVGDPGVHAACCGPNQFTISSGNPNVIINGRHAAKIGDTTKHCGGVGHITQGAA